MVVNYSLESCIKDGEIRHDRVLKYAREAADLQGEHRTIYAVLPGALAVKAFADNAEQNDFLSFVKGDTQTALDASLRMPASEICFLTELEGIPGPSGRPIHSVNGRRISRIAKEIKASGPKGSRPLEAEFHASLVTSQRGIVAHIGPAYAPLIDVLSERVGTHFVPVNPAV